MNIIDKCIDKDKSEYFDRTMTKAFLDQTLAEMGIVELSEDFEICFKEFEKDGNGTISKDAMKIFIMKVAGL